MISKQEIQDAFKSLQDNICLEIEKADGEGYFKEDKWERPGGGGGRSRVIQSNVIEKGGVNFSAVSGQLPQNIQDALKVNNNNFFATGVSIVMHPFNPHIPIIHMNVRYFELEDGTYWFGGGIDLTPHYIIDKDASFFHEKLKNTCDKYDSDFYPKFKQWADDYFYIKHRNETRGVGGVFFDKLNNANTPLDKNTLFNFVHEIGQTFAPAYTHLINKYKDTSFSHQEKEWQYIRRSRYVEFNLVYDKGTKFGLETDGRTESILMSMPPEAKWPYMHSTIEGSKEEYTLSKLKKGIEWV